MKTNWNLASDEPITAERERAVTDGTRFGWQSIRWAEGGPQLYGPVYQEPRDIRTEHEAHDWDCSHPVFD